MWESERQCCYPHCVLKLLFLFFFFFFSPLSFAFIRQIYLTLGLKEGLLEAHIHLPHRSHVMLESSMKNLAELEEKYSIDEALAQLGIRPLDDTVLLSRYIPLPSTLNNSTLCAPVENSVDLWMKRYQNEQGIYLLLLFFLQCQR